MSLQIIQNILKMFCFKKQANDQTNTSLKAVQRSYAETIQSLLDNICGI